MHDYRLEPVVDHTEYTFQVRHIVLGDFKYFSVRVNADSLKDAYIKVINHLDDSLNFDSITLEDRY